MTKGKKLALWITSAVVLLGVAAVLAFLHFPHTKPVRIEGAVIVQDGDARKRVPIANVNISVTDNVEMLKSTSNSAGFFSVLLPVSIRRGQPITLYFTHRDYKPLVLREYVSDKLYVAKMLPTNQNSSTADDRARTTVANLRVRYTIKAVQTLNIGSAVQTFQVKNTGNVPCKGHDPCSPDGRWKAAIGSATLDAGSGNEFRNARVSCIAGPCPFTRIENDDFSKDGQKITASARGWSDTTTFLVEAEVFHTMVSEIVHESHPVVFGRALNFTLPAEAEGVCIQADIAGQTIVFPLGPALFLSWANCDATGNPDQTKAYRCELKSDYKFQ